MYILFFFIAFSIVYLTGHFIISIFVSKKKSIHEIIFWKLFFGLFLTVSIYSIVKTKFQTINLGVLLLLLIFLFLEKNRKEIISRINNEKSKLKLFNISIVEIKEIVYLFISLLPIFFIKYFFLFNNDKDYPVVISRDSIYHANISQFLNKFSVESLNSNISFIPDGTHPYHYFEAWTDSFFTFLFKSNYWITIELIVHPLFLLLIISGLWTIISKINILNFFNRIISFLVIFFGGLYLERFSSNSFFNLHLRYNAFDEDWGLKLSLAYIVVIFAINLFVDKKILKGLLILNMLPIISITFSTGIIFSSIIIILFYFIYQKKYKSLIKVEFYYLLVPFMVLLFIYIFYSLTSSSYDFIKIPSIKNLIFVDDYTIFFKSKLQLLLDTLIKFFVAYSPVFLLIIIYSFNHSNNLFKFFILNQFIFVFTFIIFVISLVTYLFFETNFGSQTYFYYQSLPFLNILFVLLIITQLQFIKFKILSFLLKTMIIFTLILFVVRSYKLYVLSKKWTWDKYSTTFIDRVNEIIVKMEKPIGGEIIKYSNYPFSVYSGNTDLLGFFTIGQNIDSKNIPLWWIDITISDKKTILNPNYQVKSDVYEFKNQLLYNNDFISNDDTRFRFIKKYKLKYLFIDKDVQLEKQTKTLVKDIISDNQTGVKFIILKD